MAKTVWKRLVGGVQHAILERDRAELRALDALLSTVEKSRRGPGRRKKAATKPAARLLR